jgi:hypothetical protein
MEPVGETQMQTSQGQSTQTPSNEEANQKKTTTNNNAS